MDRILTYERIRPRRPGPAPAKSPKTNGLLAPHGWAEYVLLNDREKLRNIIQGTIASMTAERLAARYEIGLEHDSRYDVALATFCALLVRSGVRTSVLLDFLRDELPADQPDIAKIAFIETVARQLGKKWMSDDCDFIDVTVASARLQEIIKILAFEFRNLQPDSTLPFVALVTPLGEQHTLMQHLLGLLFDAMGWTSHILEGTELKGPRLQRIIEQSDMVCIGWSNQRLRREFHDLVTTIRSYRSGPRLPIIVGGVAAIESIDFLVGLGIDCICDSVYSASRICKSFHELETISQQTNGSGRRAAVNASGIDWLPR